MWTRIILRMLFIILLFFIHFYKKHENQKNNITILTGTTMGTFWQVKAFNLTNPKYIKKIIEKCLDQDEKMLSSWKKNSIVSQFNKLEKNKLQIINKNFYNIIMSSFKMNQETHGKLDITISPLINEWGFGPKKKPISHPYFKKIKKKNFQNRIKNLKIIKNTQGIFLKKYRNNIEINLSSFGEGFAADHLAYLLNKNKVDDYIISVGSAVIVKTHKNSHKPKIIAIQKPIDEQPSIHLMVYLKNHAISTSGTYRNYYYLNKHRITHVIDPQTQNPIKHNLISVSVIAHTALEADSWDTALLVVGFKEAKKISLKNKLAVCLIIKKRGNFITWTSPQFKNFLVR